jgi:hypothetical protein
MAGFPSCAAWHFVVDANGVPAVIALYDQDPLPALKSRGYESPDGMVKLLVSVLGLLRSDDFKGKRKRRAWEQVATRLQQGSAGFRFMRIVGHKSSFIRSQACTAVITVDVVSCQITRPVCSLLVWWSGSLHPTAYEAESWGLSCKKFKVQPRGVR